MKHKKGDKNMKRLLAILLVVLMAMPFALFASAATVPAEPTVAADAPKYYVSYAGTGDKSGNDASNTAPTQQDKDGIVWDKVKDGGVIIIEQKGFLNADYTFESTKPVVITALDPADNVSNLAMKDSELDTASQIGMFLIDCANPTVFTIKGDLIYKDTALVHRSTKNDVKYSVADGGALVIDASVKFGKTDACKAANDGNGYNINLEVLEGGYAYIHSLGFDNYTGKGTIVVGDEIAATVTADTFAGFEGVICKADGTALFGDAGTTTPPETGDMTWVIAVVASIAVMGCAVVSKKRA